ncbi:MAG: M23 family metallopeptidase [Pseudomonadales bacterium]
MRIIFVSSSCKQPKTVALSMNSVLAAAGLFFVLAVLGLYSWTNYLQKNAANPALVEQWQENIATQKAEIGSVRRASEARIEALAVRTAQLQSRLMRLDALAERLAGMAKLDKSEFDFSVQPAVGGPESIGLEEAMQPPEFLKTLDGLADQIELREQQLEIMENLLAKRKLRNEVFIAGRPILKGWMSSSYGYRTDPFKGHKAWHKGIDFAGKRGSDVVAVGSGVVTRAGKRRGYGQLVEISHANGYTTRYAHNAEILVSPGDIVKQGQVISKMGSSGRSTGPHVHFEVLKGGKSVNPLAYIKRARRES